MSRKMTPRPNSINAQNISLTGKQAFTFQTWDVEDDPGSSGRSETSSAVSYRKLRDTSIKLQLQSKKAKIAHLFVLDCCVTFQHPDKK